MPHSPDRVHPNYLKLAESLAQTVENPICPVSLQLEILAWFYGLDPQNVPEGPTLPTEDAARIRRRLPLLGEAIQGNDHSEVDNIDDDRHFDRIWALNI
jgi:hypothetical protein